MPSAAGRSDILVPGRPQVPVGDARTVVTSLYQVHAVGLIRLAVVMIGDRPAAEDVVQEAFCGLFRRWPQLADKEKALAYVRSCTLNGCRSELRRRIRNERRAARNAGLDTGGRVQRLTPLPIPAIPAAKFASGIAISPDASKLAAAVEQSGPRNNRNPEIRVFALATGSERTWAWRGRATITNNGGTAQSMSWTADGRTLAFQEWVRGGIEIRLLDTLAPGNDLRSSRLALNFAHEQESLRFVHGRASSIFGFSALITPDGTKIVLATVTETKPPIKSELAFTEFSATTGKVVRVLGRWRFSAYPGQTQDVLWTSPSGSKLIVVAHKPGAGTITHKRANYPIEIGVLTGNKFTPLSGAPADMRIGWPVF